MKPLRLKTHLFQSKPLCQKPMLRQNGPITKSGVLLVAAYFFFGKFFPVLEPLKKSQFDVPTTQMSIFVFFVSARV